MSEYKLVPVEPTPEMADAGAQRLASWEDGCEWPESWSPLQVAAMRNQADRAWRSMWLAAPSPKWVKVSERLPTREDADEEGYVWVAARNGVASDHWANSPFYGYWMPKPRQQPPEPPALQQEGKA